MIISYVFLPQLFSLETSNYLRLNRKTIFQVYLLQVQYFSQLQHANTRPTKLESQFQQFPSSSYAFYKIETNLKALYQLNLIPLEKYSKQQVSYFYQIVHFMMNPTKFGSLHLNTPNSRYDFCKFVYKSVKINKEKHFKNPKYATYTRSGAPTVTDAWVPQSTQPHPIGTRSRERG